MTAPPMVEVRPGDNTWVWARTDRDDATADEVRQTAIAAMALALRPLQGPAAPHEILIEPQGVSRIGFARPLRVISTRRWDEPHQWPTSAGSMTRLVDAQAVDPPPYVTGARPWRVVVDFAWRGAPGRVEWPAWRKRVIGREWRGSFDGKEGEDWLLWDAYWRGESQRPDMSWGEALGAELRQAFRVADETLVQMASEASGFIDRKAKPGLILVAGAALAIGVGIALAKR